MARQIVLLRGINLRATRRIGMADLRELLESEGYEDVRTHLQSGNVLLLSPLSPRRLETAVARSVEQRFGFDVRVLVRTRAELAKVVERDPLGKVAKDGSRYLVSFLLQKLPAKVARELESAEVAPEQVVVHGREIYSWHPGGQQRSRLRKLMRDDLLGVPSTARNWNTVTKLLELAGE
jgi:uncharacterized protein (DUF1697 family)